MDLLGLRVDAVENCCQERDGPAPGIFGYVFEKQFWASVILKGMTGLFVDVEFLLNVIGSQGCDKPIDLVD